MMIRIDISLGVKITSQFPFLHQQYRIDIDNVLACHFRPSSGRKIGIAMKYMYRSNIYRKGCEILVWALFCLGSSVFKLQLLGVTGVLLRVQLLICTMYMVDQYESETIWIRSQITRVYYAKFY